MYLVCCAGEQPVVKLIRDKVTGYPAGYGFLEFPTQHGAQLVLETYNGQVVRKCIAIQLVNTHRSRGVIFTWVTS